MAVCIAVIGKDNSPLFIATSDLDKELELQYRVHAALDVIEEKSKSGPDSKDMYLGMLYLTETHNIYGYITNTRIKIVLVVDSNSTALRENEVRNMFKNLHKLYSEAVCNPFYVPGDSLISKSFDRNVRNIMAGSN